MTERPPVRFEADDAIAHVVLDRAEKRNALSDDMVAAIGDFFTNLPDGVEAVVLHAVGDHFSAGLDLASLGETDAMGGLLHSRSWHRAFASIESGRVPVIAVLKGAVIGGGLELAAAAHIRVAERSSFYAFPEGRRGLFVGGGGSVRVSRFIGAHRMADMMLTGRVLTSDEGHTFGISNYLVDDGSGLDRALELAATVAGNSAATNFAIINALPRIADGSTEDGFLIESMMSAIAQSTDEAKQRMRDFLSGRAAKVAQAEAERDD